jgi:hypothetical protein
MRILSKHTSVDKVFIIASYVYLKNESEHILLFAPNKNFVEPIVCVE